MLQVVSCVLLAVIAGLVLAILTEVRRKASIPPPGPLPLPVDLPAPISPPIPVYVPPQRPPLVHADGAVELLVKTPAGWRHHSFRPASHRDVQEALDTPGLAVMRDGEIEEGVQ